MKNYIRTSAMATLFTLTSLFSFGQENDKDTEMPTEAKWVSENGYWQVISNVNTPKNHRVLFYNNSNICILEKDVKGIKLNIKRSRIRMKLKKELEKELLAFMQKNGAGKKGTAMTSK